MTDYQETNPATDFPPVPRGSRRRFGTRTLVAAVAVTLVLSVGLTTFALWVFGFRPVRDTASLSFENTAENIEAIRKLEFYLDVVRNGYLEKLSDAELIEKLTEGLPSALGNPYTYYLTADDHADP